MTGRKAAALAAVIVAAVAVSAYFMLFYASGGMPPPGPPSGNGTGPPPAKTAISVLSSPATFPFVEKWAAQYNNGDNLGTVQPVYSPDVDDANIPVLYSNISSFLADYSADMAITGRSVQPSGNFTYADSVFLPVSPQAIAVVYNVPGFPDVPSGIKLDAPTLYAILSGNATRWNDQRITALNPDLSLPDQPIVVVHERKAGSASDLLEKYLNSTVAWPESSQAAESPDALSATVRQTPYSIGYVDFSNAVQTRMTFAALQNSDGDYVLPSSDSIARAVQNGTVVHEPITVDGKETMAMPPTMSVGQLGNGSYPVVGFYYVALSDAPGAQKGAASRDFARWIVGSAGQQMLADVQYPSIYDQNEELKAMGAELATGMSSARFENATNLTNNPSDSVYGQVAASGDMVYVVWEESVSGDNYDIFFKKSQNSGKTFESGVTNLSKNAGLSEHPQMAAAGSVVYVTWTDNSTGTKEVMFAKSTSSGNAFSRPMSLSNSNNTSYNPEIVASGSNVYAVWQEQRGNSTAIVMRASADGGNTFAGPVTVVENSNPESFPKVAADGNAVHVVWGSPNQPGLRHVSSTNGTAFSQATLLNDGGPVGEAQVAAYGSSVFVVWGGLNSHSVDKLTYAASTDGGATFTKPAMIDTIANPMNVELALTPGQNGGQFVHIVSQVGTSQGNEEILLVSTADGSIFTEPVNLSNNAGTSECPSIAVSGNSIYVVWEDRTSGNNEILFARGSVP